MFLKQIRAATNHYFHHWLFCSSFLLGRHGGAVARTVASQQEGSNPLADWDPSARSLHVLLSCVGFLRVLRLPPAM